MKANLIEFPRSWILEKEAEKLVVASLLIASSKKREIVGIFRWQLCGDCKETCKRMCGTCKVIASLNKAIVFSTFSLPSPSLLLKEKNSCACNIKMLENLNVSPTVFHA